MIQLNNDDCFNIFPTLEDKSINLFILDLPYGQTACHWDSVIDLDEMWKHIKRIMKPNALIVFFCTAKFGNTLINANPKWFKYDLIWKKSRKVGFLSANKMPLRQHENIYVFKDQQGTYHPQKTEGKAYKHSGKRSSEPHYGGILECNKEYNGDRHPTSIIDHENIYVFDNPVNEEYNDLELSRNKDLREYAEKVYKFIGKGLTTINKKLGHRRAEHFFYFKTTQFGLCTIETYNQLIKEYKINEMDGFLDYEILDALWEDAPPKVESTYNSQKTEGKEIKMKRKNINQNIVYGENVKLPTESIYKDRHPTSIIDHENIYVFDNTITDDIELSRNKDLREYAEKVYKFIGKTKKEIIKKIGQKIDHFFRFKSSQFGLCVNETYDELIKHYKINEMEGFLDYDILKSLEELSTYNPQKTEGKPYKTIGSGECEVYGAKRLDGNNTGDRHPTSIIEHENLYVFKKEQGTYNPQKTEGKPYKAFETKNNKKIGEVYGGKSLHNENKGDRHPTSIIENTILEYNNPHKSLHRTQKPVELCEWLIKTYTNEDDIVMDFTMGSGTTGIACSNTNRDFIGVEMDKEIFEIAQKRILEHLS
jgi:DNA modification methylase